MNTPQILICFLIMASGAFLNGVAGLGINLFVVPILIMVEPRLVPGPTLIGALFLTVLMVLRERSEIDLRVVGLMFVGSLPGIALASFLLPIISSKTFALVLGAIVLAGVMLSLSGVRFPPKWWVLLSAGFVAGIGNTLASIDGPPVALVNQDLEPRKLRATLSSYFFISGLVSVIVLTLVGRLGKVELGLSLWLLPGIILGFLCSTLLIRKVSKSVSRYLLLAISASSGVILILRQILR
jgi:uncharacterized protein